MYIHGGSGDTRHMIQRTSSVHLSLKQMYPASSKASYNEHGANIRVQCKNGYTLATKSDRSVIQWDINKMGDEEEGI